MGRAADEGVGPSVDTTDEPAFASETTKNKNVRFSRVVRPRFSVSVMIDKPGKRRWAWRKKKKRTSGVHRDYDCRSLHAEPIPYL